jgi:hypothetical protein
LAAANSRIENRSLLQVLPNDFRDIDLRIGLSARRERTRKREKLWVGLEIFIPPHAAAHPASTPGFKRCA